MRRWGDRRLSVTARLRWMSGSAKVRTAVWKPRYLKQVDSSEPKVSRRMVEWGSRLHRSEPRPTDGSPSVSVAVIRSAL
jgi:hypothetical protein